MPIYFVDHMYPMIWPCGECGVCDSTVNPESRSKIKRSSRSSPYGSSQQWIPSSDQVILSSLLLALILAQWGACQSEIRDNISGILPLPSMCHNEPPIREGEVA